MMLFYGLPCKLIYRVYIKFRADGVGRADARDRFEWADALVGHAHPGEDARPRFRAIGFRDGDLVTLIFSLLGTEAVSAISLRPAARAERTLFDHDRS